MKIKLNPAKVQELPYADLVHHTTKHIFSDLTDDALTDVLRTSKTKEQRCAVIKEVVQRIKHISLFDTQLSTVYSLLNKSIAELPTGEGKTLAAVIAAICYALDGHKVHILVFNDYLAKRDWSENSSIYNACGVSVGFVDQYATIQERKSAYASDVIYVSAKQAGFDYLRDFMTQAPDEVVFPDFDVAIVDEADSIMIDECTTPLVLAGKAQTKMDTAKDIDECIRNLSDDDYELSHTEHQVWLTEKGIDHVEKHFGISLYVQENLAYLSEIHSALEAHHLLIRDKDYIIKDGTIQLVEASTGRVVINKRYPDLLHRAVEIKEGLEPAPLTMIYNSIPMQRFLRLYPTLCGMTGTASTSANEFETTYNLSVDTIPPHKPSIRIDHEDAFFTDHQLFMQSVTAQIRDCYSRKQPVLVGTKTVPDSEMFSALLENANIPHRVLNAKNDEQEAAIIAEAGTPGRVTVSTNMAGRGVDIKLGGINEKLRNEAVAAGGLFIVGAGINPSGRIDNQLRGRAGRQGDPGHSKFFIWLEDTGISYRLSPLEKIKAEIGTDKKRVNTVRRVQREMEREAAEARYSLGRYSAIVEEQRLRLFKMRMEILNGKSYTAYLEHANPSKYNEILHEAGIDGIKRAEQQLALYFINRYWAECLDALENIRKGIHFMALRHDSLAFMGSQGSPLDEYFRIAINLYNQMFDGIKKSITEKMEAMPITKDGINMDDAMFHGASTTWTYAMDESMYQFNTLARIAKNVRNKLSGEDGILTKYYRRKRDLINKS